jgi:3-mercaptopyruvate sulfurtransferase SseA
VYANAEAGLCSSPSTTRPSVSVAEASGLRAHPGVAFGDARPAEEYALGHVAGAWHLPCFGNAGAETLAHLGGASTLIVYGQDEAQAEAHRVAEELGRRGFADVRVLSGGWRAWQAAGLPAESGPCDECKKP